MEVERLGSHRFCPKIRSSKLSSDRNQLLIPVATILVVVGIAFIFPFSAACGQHQRGKWGYGGVWLEWYTPRNTRKVAVISSMCCSFVASARNSFLWNSIRAQFKYQPVPHHHPNYMTRFLVKNDQKAVKYPILPLSEIWVKIGPRNLAKNDHFFAKKLGKSENIPLFCQKWPQKPQILL